MADDHSPRSSSDIAAVAAAKIGHLDDRVERYLPVSLYAVPATVEANKAKGASSGKAKYRVAPKSANGRQKHHVDTPHPVAAKVAHV